MHTKTRGVTTSMKKFAYQVTEIELYLSEVGDGDPDLQFTPQEEYVMHQRCLGRWTAYNEDDLRNRIFDFIGYHAEHLKYEVRPCNS